MAVSADSLSGCEKERHRRDLDADFSFRDAGLAYLHLFISCLSRGRLLPMGAGVPSDSLMPLILIFFYEEGYVGNKLLLAFNWKID
jgi:hypothetical protein